MTRQHDDTDDSIQPAILASPSQWCIPYHWRCNIHTQELSNGITNNTSFQTGMQQAYYFEITNLKLNSKTRKRFNFRTFQGSSLNSRSSRAFHWQVVPAWGSGVPLGGCRLFCGRIVLAQGQHSSGRSHSKMWPLLPSSSPTSGHGIPTSWCYLLRATQNHSYCGKMLSKWQNTISAGMKCHP